MILFSRSLFPIGDTARRIFGTELPYIIERNLLNKYFVLVTANYIKFFRGVMNGFYENNERITHSQFVPKNTWSKNYLNFPKKLWAVQKFLWTELMLIKKNKEWEAFTMHIYSLDNHSVIFNLLVTAVFFPMTETGSIKVFCWF